MKKLIILILCCCFLVSCATGKKLNRQEQLTYKKRNIDAASKIYTGFSREQILSAVEQVLTLIDRSDAKFEHFDNKIIMTRFFMAYLVFNNVFGYDYWIISIEDLVDDRIKVEAIVINTVNQGMTATVPSKPPLSSVKIEDTILSEAEAKLFYKRIDHILGIEEDWILCKDALSFAKENNYQTSNPTIDGKIFGHFPYICGDGYWGIEDNSPAKN